MEFIKADQATRRQNSNECLVTEYEFKDERDIDGAIIDLEGRYPAKGLAMNEVCKELVYVVEGEAMLTCNDQVTTLEKGDMALIKPGDRYFFEGHLKLLISSSPAWYLEQHKNV
jgi:mannose-6-phosphate isomerase-like protein (cupin superfamily)